MFKHFAAVVALVAATAACHSEPKVPGGTLAVALQSATAVALQGLSTAELKTLSAANLDAASWQRAFAVAVKGQTSAIAGTYRIENNAIVFRPAFPLDPGRAYEVAIDLSSTPVARTPSTLRTDIALPDTDRTPSTKVVRIDPSAAEWPANLLRAYVYFSAPMASESGLEHITLKDEAGRAVERAFLTVEAEFWNPERTRYTVFFDPGRVKQGIRPNRELGRPLVAGHRYSIEINASWRDAQGKALASPFQRTFNVSEAVERPLTMETWMIRPPNSGTQQTLVVAFPTLMDRALTERALSVIGTNGQTMKGESALADDGRTWTFRPAVSWGAGAYQLRAASMLEDPAGNQIGRAFEVDMKKPAPAVPASAYVRAFAIK